MLAFLSIILIPILMFIGITSLYTFHIEHVTEQEQELTEQLINSIHKLVIEKHELLDDPDAFYKEIYPIIKPYMMGVVISTFDREKLFDSRFIEGRPQMQFMFTIWESQVQALTGERFHIEIQSDSIRLMPDQAEEKIIDVLLIAISSALLVLVVLMIGWTVYIARTILNPLKEIYTATEEMTVGNLDYKISYRRKDELGRFIEGFNLMRSHLKQSLANQRQYEQNRKELIATISHDLRTPLQSIKGYVEGINDGIVQNEEMKKKYLQVILSKTEQLDRLIDDLFDFSKIELDQLAIEKNVINSQEFLGSLFEYAKMDNERKSVKFNVTNSIPSVLIDIDPVRIEQAITNLLDNAVRYGGTEINITISIDLLTKSLSIEIKDNGIGISKEDLPNVFDLFFRGEKSRSREFGGTGLGLAIVKKIIKAHDGTITVESEVGRGSLFIIRLPFVEKKL